MNLKKKLVVGILGVGEVGSTILTLVSKKYKVFTKDMNKDSINNQKLNILHICIPYSSNFEKIVIKQIQNNKPDLTIIESTIPLKTTEKIFKAINKPIVHSPIRGCHKTMVSDLKRFTKYIGSVNRRYSQQAQKYYKTIGVKAKIVTSPRETELGKLLDTTYYALCIAWHQEMERFCKMYNISFEESITSFNKTYNMGYKRSKPNVVRPVLKPGFIEGHCLMPNIRLLKTFINSPFLDIIEDSNEKKQKEIDSTNL